MPTTRRLQLLIAVLLLAVAAPSALAQQGGSTDVILVLDASGSMFNRLADGRYRITAAKEALTAFISRLPESAGLNVGLRVYGSQVRATEPGACEDSRLTVPVLGLPREQLLRSVQDTQARGATPIAYSLELAAGDLSGAAGRKLIVLVTDGEESCGGDVRAVAERLAAAGIDVDLRIIGFDLDERAVQSFQGIGTFENATNAGELADALGRAVELAPAQAAYRVTVRLLRGGQPATDGGAVRFFDALDGSGHGFAAAEDGLFVAELPAGSYRAEVQDAFGEPVTFGGLSVAADEQNLFEFELAAEFEVQLEVEPQEPVAGGEVSVRYQGAGQGHLDWITVVPVGAPDELYLHWVIADAQAGELLVRIPVEEGELEARYHLALPEGGTRVVGRSAPFTSRAAVIALEAPETIGAGTPFEVRWQGPDNRADYVTVVPEGADDLAYLAYFYTASGNPGRLVAPIDPGRYELRYVSGGGGVLGRRAIEVVETQVSLTAPVEVTAGHPIEVAWTGPGAPNDYITVVAEGAAEGSYTSYAYTRDGPLAQIQAPIEPGRYELRYVEGSGNATLASIPLLVVAGDIAVSAPASVAPGSHFEVRWTGPNGSGDYLTIVPVGAPEGSYNSYAYTRDGAVLTLVAPMEPGAYEVRYVFGRTDGTLASTPIEVR